MRSALRLVFEVIPTPDHPQAGVLGGAFASFWTLEHDRSTAEAQARAVLAEAQWTVLILDTSEIVTADNCAEGDAEEYFAQVQVDPYVVVFHTWPIDADPIH